MRKTKLVSSVIALAFSVMAYSNSSQAADKITFVLNWFPTADHSPYYLALDKGWYSDAGLDVTIETAKGWPHHHSELVWVRRKWGLLICQPHS